MNIYRRYLIYSAVLLSLFALQGCDLVIDIFSVGFWVGIIIAVLVVVLVVWLIIKGMKKMG